MMCKKITIKKQRHNGLGDQGSIPGRVIPKTQIMVLDAALLNTQHNKIRIKGKVKESRESSRKGAFRSPLTKVTNFTYFTQTVTINVQ